MYRLIEGLIGYPQIGQVSASETIPQGEIQQAYDQVFGGGEVMFVKAGGTIPVWAAVTILPTWNATTLRYDLVATAVANSANQSRPLAVAPQAMVANDFGWVFIAGTVPVSSTASVAAAAALGVAAAGQLGASAAGKNVFGAVSVAPSTTTVVKAGSLVTNGSKQIVVPNTAGLFVGQIASGTGIAALSIVTAIDEVRNIVTIAVAATATGSAVSVTFTNQDGTIFYNTVSINRPTLTNITV